MFIIKLKIVFQTPRQNGEGTSKSNEKQLKFELDPILESEGGDVAYVTVDASSLEGGGEHSGPLIHLQNIYPSTSNGHSRYIIWQLNKDQIVFQLVSF